MVNLIRNKKAAAEVFNLVIPIILFMLVCMLIFILFNIINTTFTVRRTVTSVFLDDELKDMNGSIDTNFVSLSMLLSTNYRYIDENGVISRDYNISLYEIIYYGLEDRYEFFIRNHLSKLGNLENNFPRFLVYTQGSSFTSSSSLDVWIRLETSATYLGIYSDRIIINDKIVKFSKYVLKD
jgi:hypothetical protein